jgi:hypothetical protein
MIWAQAMPENSINMMQAAYSFVFCGVMSP